MHERDASYFPWWQHGGDEDKWEWDLDAKRIIEEARTR